jgi:GNAT superfamily N-acetyltransferase
MIFVAASMSLAFRSFIFFGDLAQLRAADGARLKPCPARLRARLQLGRLLQQEARRRRLGGEGEAAVGIDGDHRRDRRALLELLRGGVERLAEFHDVDAALAQRRADRRRRIGDARGHLQLDVAGDFLCHVSLSSPQAAGRGIARQMCLHSLDHAKARGYRAMQFNFVVSTNERAVRLWTVAGLRRSRAPAAGVQSPGQGLCRRPGHVPAAVVIVTPAE